MNVTSNFIYQNILKKWTKLKYRTKEEKVNEPFMMPRIKSKKKNGRKETKLQSLLSISAAAMS